MRDDFLCILDCRRKAAGGASERAGALEPTANYFLEGGKVVRAFYCLNPETAIVILEWLAVLKHNHGGDGVRTLRVGDVIALNAAREFRQVELFLEFRECSFRRRFVREYLDAQGFEALQGVFSNELQQLFALSALRNDETHLATFPSLLKPFRDGRTVGDGCLREDARRHDRAVHIELFDESGKNFAVRFPKRAVQQKIVAFQQSPAADEEDFRPCLVACAGDGNDVLVDGMGGNGLLLSGDTVDGVDLVAEERGALAFTWLRSL